MVTKNFNVVSKQESLEGKQDAKYIKKAKEDLLETLQLDQKMVNRNQMADALAKNRFENGKNGINLGIPAGEINIRDTILIKINEKKYKNILDEYQKVITEKPNDLDAKLAKLDTLLVERMLLDSGNMIEFKSTDNFDGGKPAKEESKIAYDELNKLHEYTGKIDLVSKKDRQGKDYFVIKWTDKQLKEIQKKADEIKKQEIEKAYEATHGKEKPEDNGNAINKGNKIKQDGNNNQQITGQTVTINNYGSVPGVGQAGMNQAANQGTAEAAKPAVTAEPVVAVTEPVKPGTVKPAVTAEPVVAVTEPVKPEVIEPAVTAEPVVAVTETVKPEVVEPAVTAEPVVAVTEPVKPEVVEPAVTAEPVVAVIEPVKPATIEGPQSGVPTLQNTQGQTANTLDEASKEALRKLKKQLEAMKIGATTDLTMPDGKIIKLQKKDEKGWICLTNQVTEFDQYIDKDHFVVENGNKSYISYVSNESLWKFLNIPEDEIIIPTPIPEPIEEEEGELGPVELTATISDTTQITRAIAERQAGEKLRKIYKNTARYKPRSWPTKATLFLGRGYMKDHYTRKYMNMKGGMQRDENLVKGADRHEMEEGNKFNEAIKNVGNIDENNYPRTYEAIDELGKKLTGEGNTFPNPRERGIDDGDFQNQFKAIIRKNLDTTRPATATDANRKPLVEIIKSNDIQQMSSNITLKLNGFRDHQKMAWDIADRITRNPTETDVSFNAFSRGEIIKYFNTYKKNPEFLKTMKIKLDDPTAMQELRRLQAHSGALTHIAAQTMRLKVQILVKGEEAYDVKQDLKGFKGGMTKIGNRLDKPISDTSRFGKWMEKHPFAKNAFGTLRGITKLGVMITPAILLAPLGPLAVAGGAGGMAFAKTLFKKYAHYNKEHIGYQRNQATNLLNNTAERDRLMNEMSKMNPASRVMLYYFGLGKKARDVRQFRDYVMTTHDQLENSNTLGAEIEGLLKKPQLTDDEQKKLEKYICKGLARLDFHTDTGQNFLGSKDKDVAEKEYQNIYRLVLTGSMRLNKDLGDKTNPATGTLRSKKIYDEEMDLINNGTGDPKNQGVDEIGYQKSRKRFKHRQTEKALLGAVKAGGVAFGLSYLATSLASSKASTHAVSGHEKVGDNFLLGKHELAGNNDVYTQSKDFFGNTNAGHQTINFQYGGGTDATHVVTGHLTQGEYLTKVVDAENQIMHMTNISATTKANLINEIHTKPRESVRAQKGFTNDYLQGMRCIEGLEQTAKALNDSGVNASTITLNAGYNGSIYDIVGHTYKNAGERVVQGALDYSQTITTPAHTIPIPIPGYMNTFKEPDRYDEQGKPRRDEQGRRTRSPAPEVTPQTENKPTRRRSGESVEDTQFTNASN